VFIREFQKRNKGKLEEEANNRYESRQILRRQVRALRNSKRAERREKVEEDGGDPDEEVSADEADSVIDFEIRPERLTPESSPEPGAVPRRAEGDEEEAVIEEAEYIEPPAGAAPIGEDDDEEEEEQDEPAPIIEEEAFDENMHAQDERREDENDELDPELRALGFALGPNTGIT
jgi:hypothetical protein